MGESDPRTRLKELGDRLDKARQVQRPAQSTQGAGTNAARGQGMRVGFELLASVAIGVLIGWTVDKGLGTRPWGMIIFFFLGIAAGMWNVYRAVAGLGMAVGVRRGTREGNAAWDDEDED
jgi:ATP synthase protein I